MKKMSKIALSIITVGIFVAGCATTNESVSDNSLSLRKANVQSESTIKLNKVNYTNATPGEAKKIERSYDNAPPLIPHSVEGLLPITRANNSCLGCHMPEVASSVHATAIPKSHFINFRPTEIIAKNGKLIKKGDIVARPNGGANDVFATSTHGKLYAGRFNCTQCHVPQSNAKPLVGNTFKPDYMNKKQMNQSNFVNTYDQGINTVK
ncbi:MAG: nitrate reductase cytochrome c-type subunit [Sulfurospirillum sp.]